jgi:hypothetical protein
LLLAEDQLLELAGATAADVFVQRHDGQKESGVCRRRWQLPKAEPTADVVVAGNVSRFGHVRMFRFSTENVTILVYLRRAGRL